MNPFLMIKRMLALRTSIVLGLPEASMDAEPFALFDQWFEEAKRYGFLMPEAMALATPVVASDIAVFREVSAMGRGVALVDCANSETLSCAMLAEPADVTVRPEKMDKAVMESAYVSLYDSVGAA